MALAEKVTSPRAYLQAQTRWRPVEIVFWLATLLPYRAVSELSLARQPDRHHRAVRAVARSDPRLCGHRLARPRRLFRRRRLYGGPCFEARLGRAVDRAGDGGARGRHCRLCYELRHLPVSASRADHAHARLRAVAGGACQQLRLADRRHGRPAGHPYLEAVRPFPLRSLRLHRLQLRACRAVRAVPVCAAAHSFAVRAVAARHPRKLRAHAGDRRAARRRICAPSTPSPPASPASPARCWRRPPKPCRWIRSASSAPPKWWSCSCSAAPAGFMADWSAPSSSWSRATSFPGIEPQYWYFWIGILLVAVVMFLPNGILGGLAKLVVALEPVVSLPALATQAAWRRASARWSSPAISRSNCRKACATR